MHWLIACCFFALTFVTACSRNDNNIHYTVSDSEDYYTIKAKYNRQQSGEVDRFLNRFFESSDNDISFAHTIIDADLTLDDGTKFYMKKSPGYLTIKFNKNSNAQGSYIRMKSLGKNLKTVIITL